MSRVALRVRWLLPLVFVFSFLGEIAPTVSGESVAVAQGRAKGNRRGKSGGKRGRRKARTEKAERAAPGDKEGAAAQAEDVKEGDSKVRVYKFSGLDVTGRLKSPQMLYFLNRLRAEFDRPKLPHRSFLPELVRSSEREPF
ncbi:MAG: hypothetical protein KC416_10125 [Myxococcales bacterium]|nr:hypothetical protein [Myxococcales bacterium]